MSTLDQRTIDLTMGKILKIGVYSACFITLVGILLLLKQSNGINLDYTKFKEIDIQFRTISSIIPLGLQGDGIAIIQIGLALLIFTPLIPVFFSIIAFLIEKDYLYVVIGLIVLCIILFNFFFGV